MSIVCILCQTAEVSAKPKLDSDVFNLIQRVLDIVTNEIVENDLKTAENVNRLLSDLPAEMLAHPYFADKRVIPLTVIRPAAEIRFLLDSFTSEDIRRMLDPGTAGCPGRSIPGAVAPTELEPGHASPRRVGWCPQASTPTLPPHSLFSRPFWSGLCPLPFRVRCYLRSSARLQHRLFPLRPNRPHPLPPNARWPTPISAP